MDQPPTFHREKLSLSKERAGENFNNRGQGYIERLDKDIVREVP